MEPQELTTPKYNESIPVQKTIIIPPVTSTPDQIDDDQQIASFRPNRNVDTNSSSEENHSANPREINIEFKQNKDNTKPNNVDNAHLIFQGKLATHDESMEKQTGFEKVEDSVLFSPTKSILKRASIREGDMSPDRKKKGVAFSLKQNTTENFLANLDDPDKPLDDSFVRQRSRSNDYERRQAASLEKQDIPRNYVTRNVSVGRVQDGVAILLSEDFCVMEVPLSMLPSDVRKGNILKFTIERNLVEEESRKENIVRVQRELLTDKTLFDEYNKKLEHFKNKKMEVLQAGNKKNINLQKVIDDVHVNLAESSFLDRSGFIEDDDRVIIRPKNIAEAKLEKNEAISTKNMGLRKIN